MQSRHSGMASGRTRERHASQAKPPQRPQIQDAVCPTCREPGRPVVLSRIDEGSPLVGRTLAEVGVPPFDVVRVDEEAGEARFFLLAGDRDGLASGWGLDR